MKSITKILFIALITLLFASKNSQSQTCSYHPFNFDSAVWYVETYLPNYPLFGQSTTYYERYFFVGDTLIDTLLYHNLYIESFNQPNVTNGTAYNCLIREDTSQKKLYQLWGSIIPFPPPQDTIWWESIIYDFNWQVGDTIKPNTNPDSECNSQSWFCPNITNIDTITIFGKCRKRFTYAYYQVGWDSPIYEYLYDGLGFNMGFNHWWYFAENGFSRYLFCYSDNAPNHIEQSCQNQISLILKTNKVSSNSRKFLFTNYLSNNIEFISTQKQIFIYDMLGNVLFKCFDVIKIDISNLANGIYLISNSLETEKIIINHK